MTFDINASLLTSPFDDSITELSEQFKCGGFDSIEIAAKGLKILKRTLR